VGARPQNDDWVRRWYRATVAALQRAAEWDSLHVDHAREIFPSDPYLLFLSGCLHEAFASAPVQNVMRTADVPSGFSFDIESPKSEWRKAERFFDQAVRADPTFGEARIRHGRVLGELDRHADALAQLQEALKSTADPLLQYYGELFAGAEQEALGRYADARAAYERAAAWNPSAQAPHLALSHLARRTGDRKGAFAAMQRVFETAEDIPDDPWWAYYVTPGRDAETLLDGVRAPFK
jgi:tetratricopeptide (TPR) repeat protein